MRHPFSLFVEPLEPAPSLSKDEPGMLTARRQVQGEGSGWRRVALDISLLARAAMCLRLATALLLLPAAGQPAHASWLTRLAGGAEHAAPRVAKTAAGAFDNAALHVRSLPARTDGAAVLAAQASQEGHWHFVNKAGETFTAGTPDELKRVATVLLPELKADAKLALYLTEDTIFLYRAALKDLPKGAELFIVAGNESYRVQRRGEGAAERLFAQVRPSLFVELAERRKYEEAVWQLARPLNKANVRVLALEPGGPSRLASTPRIDPVAKRALVDAIDPASLPAALGTVRGQTLLVTGRVEGRLLYVQPSSGAERSILLPDLFKAAEEADVNLVVLRAASTPRQPGGRNWLWQKVEVRGLDQAMQHARLADFLDALGGANSRLLVTANASGRRTSLEVRPGAELSGGPLTAPVGGLFSGLVSDVTGRVVVTGLEANMRSAERQRELDQRLVPGIPADIQAGYLALFVLGLLGVPISRAWWRRLWPPEMPTEYAGRTGYWAARTVRAAAFLLLFLPLTAPVTAPLNLWRQLRDALTTPVRWWRRLAGRRAAPSPGPV
jgi:hypothetical protein